MAAKEERRQSSKSFKDKMPTLVLLETSGLEEYYQFFEKAGFKFFEDMFETDGHPDDMKVETALIKVERACGVMFTSEVRVQLWKALRYKWFRGLWNQGPFIDRVRVPLMSLPKPDYTEVDWHIRLQDIDPDRQRQFLRKTRPTKERAFRGPARSTTQFETYRRQADIMYEFKDIERSIVEWQNRNPKTMYREDPREQVMKLRLRSTEEIALALLAKAQADSIFCCRWLFPNVPAMKLQRLLYKCQWQLESISDFRTETEELRLDPAEAAVTSQWNMERRKQPRQKKERDRSQRRRRKRKPITEDTGADIWTKKDDKANTQAGSAEDETEALNSLDPVAAMKKALDESYERLPKKEIELRHRGGERMGSFAGKLGMPRGHEDNLVVRLPRLGEADEFGWGNEPSPAQIGLSRSAMSAQPSAMSYRSSRSSR